MACPAEEAGQSLPASGSIIVGRCLGWFYTILGIAFVTGGVLRGSGDMRMFTTASIANLSFRVIGSILLAPRFGVDTVWYVVPVGWLLYASLCYISYRKKNWAIISR